jgi:hypothetical protein
MTIGCLAVRRQLGPFVDGELRGAQMLVVADHLDNCGECAAEVLEMGAVGEALRSGSPRVEGIADLGSLAGTVVSLSRAASDDTWRARLMRACEDWHWPLVAGGSMAATCLSTVLVSVILSVGPGPERDDSLAGLIANLVAPPSPVYVFASSARSGDEPIWMQLDNGRTDVDETPLPEAWPSTAAYREPSEADVVRELAESVTYRGRVQSLDSMRQADRPKVEKLLDSLTKFRDARPARVSQTASVHGVWLVATIGVRATDLP